MGVRGVLVRLLGLLGNIILARLLVPRQFGVVAFGATLMAFMGFLSDAGLGAGFIRRRDAPIRTEFESLVGLQLVLSILFTLAIAAVAWPFGQVGRITAVMVAGLPILTLKTPGWVILERNLLFKRLVTFELMEWIAFYVWAVATVAMGWGVWGYATASIVRAVTGSTVMISFGPVGFVRPSLSLHRIRGLLRFGAQYQAVELANLVRLQGVNIGTGIIAGVSVLGLWTLASRLLQIPFLVFESLWRVSYPAIARLVKAGEEPRPLLERGVGIVAVGTGVLLVPLVAAAPAFMPSVFGPEWSPASVVVPAAAVGLLINGPISVATAGYLYSAGETGTVLRAMLLSSVTWFAITFPLLVPLGVVAVGLGWTAASLIEAVILGRKVHRLIGARLVSPMVTPTLLAAICGGSGAYIASSVAPTIGAALVIGSGALAVYVAGVAVARRSLLGETVGIVMRAFRATVARTG